MKCHFMHLVVKEKENKVQECTFFETFYSLSVTLLHTYFCEFRQ